MNIGFFTTGFPYKWPFERHPDTKESMSWGGVEEVTYQLALLLNKKGHKIIIFTTSMDHTQEVQQYENITVYRYPRSIKVEHTEISISLLFKPLYHDVDVLHIQRGSPPGAIAGYLYAKIKKKPFVLSYHGEPESKGGMIKKVSMSFFNVFLPKILKDANVITALSSEFVNSSKFLSNYKNKIQVIPNGICTDNFDISSSKSECRDILGLPANKNIILFVGSLTEKKAPHVLLKAMKKVIKKIPDSYVIFVGDGACKKKLKCLSQELGIEMNVNFTGFIADNNTKMMYYKSADIFVLPSLLDAFPMSLLEASAMGLPLIASRLESLKAIIEDEYNGLFTICDDESDLSKKIIYLLQDERVRLSIGINAKYKANDFSWEKIADKVENIYKNIVY
ncbi:glycosyltransferase family 4 protein [Methanosarcina sp. 2.H.A.1B.4]|uniref:glycosyltransferase family 4 protein n=1 Tax=Methanosarcina sp. 2.H.A.1B.4 TaxID=1483600 RepID=UPI00062153EB|nr:glycosyltransferase family 4 protein [Methanosarcina sp. 2.H.A.1B.4]KKG09293.1 hypothetical protein EO92_06120 [Methanosarcina sp. 2.H.A.1B.4]